MDNNTDCYPTFKDSGVKPPSLIGYADVVRYTGTIGKAFTFFGYIPLTYKINFYDDDEHPGIKISQYDDLIDSKILEKTAHNVLLDISKRVLNQSTPEDILILRIFGHPNTPIFPDDTLYHKTYVLCNGDLVLIPICGIQGDHVEVSYTDERQCISDMGNDIKYGIVELVKDFDNHMFELL